MLPLLVVVHKVSAPQEMASVLSFHETPSTTVSLVPNSFVTTLMDWVTSQASEVKSGTTVLSGGVMVGV